MKALKLLSQMDLSGDEMALSLIRHKQANKRPSPTGPGAR